MIETYPEEIVNFEYNIDNNGRNKRQFSFWCIHKEYSKQYHYKINPDLFFKLIFVDVIAKHLDVFITENLLKHASQEYTQFLFYTAQNQQKTENQ